MSLLKQDTTKKKRMNKLFPEPEPELDVGNNKKYEVEAIKDSAIYAKEAERYLLGLYYLVSWKSYLKEKSNWKLFFAVIHLRKMISTFHKNYSKKLMVIFLPLNSAPPMAMPSVKPVKSFAKQKQSHLTRSTKQAKK